MAACSALMAVSGTAAADGPRFDLGTEHVLYCVGYAHLDTQWRWDYPTTIDRFILNTLDENFALFEKFPEYVFNFTGSARYAMMKEYYPARYERLKGYIADGRWYVSGSSVDEGDANVPSPESMIRQVLYGNLFFEREFGKESVDFMLPDCFGFPASMPSIWAHCGLKGFSTQKLTWGSAVGIPFHVGLWEGPDGASVIAALDPGPYVGAIEGPVQTNAEWSHRIQENGERFGLWADYHYYGVGDMGGAPHEADVQNYVESMKAKDGNFRVALTSSDQLYRDVTPAIAARLPRYRGDLLLTQHSAGTLTSQSYMKRWNRKCENLADAAERGAVGAWWLGARAYPREHLERGWVRFLANQMHDILPGTSIPRAYTYSWNDEIIAQNLFASTVTDSTRAIASMLDTSGTGIPVVVVNPLAIAREDVVEARVEFPEGALKSVRVVGPDGAAVASQIIASNGASITVAFAADVRPVSWTVFHVVPTELDRATDPGGPRATGRTLENEHLRVEFNDAGDIASIVEKSSGTEALASPARLAFTHEKPQQYPAWNMDWADRQCPPIGFVDGPPKFRITERGPVRVSLEVKRESRGSIITQTYRLSRGDAGRALECDAVIDWQSDECALKASFPLAVSNDQATYDWGVGTIERGNNSPIKYEVPSHEWFDLSAPDGSRGVSILEDSKYGSDKPDANEVRLTLLYTPGVRSSYLDQHSQDWGRHDITYCVYPHDGDWRMARSQLRARRLNQPLRAFVTSEHPGSLGREFSFASISTPQMDIRAIKKAERSDEIIVRAQELWGVDAKGVEVGFAGPVVSASEVNGQERPITDARVANGRLVFDCGANQPRTFAVRLERPSHPAAPPRWKAVALAYDADATSVDADGDPGAMDGSGRSMPAELVPEGIESGSVGYALAPRNAKNNALACRGQRIEIPEGFDQVHLLLAADEDVDATFRVGDTADSRTVQSWTGFIGQWDNREWDRPFEEVDYRCEGHVTKIVPGYIKREPIAWFATHRHGPDAQNEAYHFAYMFEESFDVGPGDRVLTLPDDPRVKVFAASVSIGTGAVVAPASPLYDDFTDRKPIELRHVYPAPPMPTFEGVEPVGRVRSEREESFDALTLAHPSAEDDAEGLPFRSVDHTGAWHPHPGSGMVGDVLVRLSDGEVAQNEDDTDRCIWHDNEGRFVVDLGSTRMIDRVATYSRHRSNRAPQFFSLWGATGEAPPDPTFGRGGQGAWTLVGVVDTRELGAGGVHASVIDGAQGKLGPYRYLLWIAEDIGQGTFFTETDVEASGPAGSP